MIVNSWQLYYDYRLMSIIQVYLKLKRPGNKYLRQNKDNAGSPCLIHRACGANSKTKSTSNACSYSSSVSDYSCSRTQHIIILAQSS